VFFDAAPGLPIDPLLPYIERRVTQRRPMATTPLTAEQIERLQQSVGPGYRLLLLAEPAQRRRMAGLLFRSARIRLTIPEAFAVHRSVIQWHARFSEDRIPDQAVGADWLSLRVMQGAMKSWNRIRLLNRYFAGTLLPRLQLDVLPALRCAAHFALLAEHPPQSLDDYVNGGRAVQRLWLTAAALDLQFQPEMTPLIFSGYARSQLPFTQAPEALRQAAALNDDLQQFIGAAELERAVFLGRMGLGPRPRSRSLRLPLDRLMVPHNLTESLAVAHGHG
jgi:sulfur-carrier protein adenylyltransferase/sulfurtransferase